MAKWRNGRRARFKIWWEKSRGGSSPPLATNILGRDRLIGKSRAERRKYYIFGMGRTRERCRFDPYSLPSFLKCPCGEMADALDLGSGGRNPVEVRLLSRVPKMIVGKWYIEGLCKVCGWTDSWAKVGRKPGKKYETIIYCPSCKKEGVTIIYKDAPVT